MTDEKFDTEFDKVQAMLNTHGESMTKLATGIVALTTSMRRAFFAVLVSSVLVLVAAILVWLRNPA